eukprot:TRINITY_DN40892_c0_g2_i1.p1 TRINITY_DN40892_c0_g2~~TRINITY_DN40892_c0_g2_i1.p1  ORF type:complete len:426 (-),score=68.21 TRINITY_DN40892_c0_g2_i1:85-1362(-)
MSSPQAAKPEPPQAPFVLYACLTLLFGTLNSLTGPALPEFAAQTHEELSSMGCLFMYRGLGSMAGGLLVGFILDQLRDPHRVLVALLVLKVVVEASMPYGFCLHVVGCQLFVVAMCANAISTVGSTCVAWTYGKLMGPKVNLMNALFGIGACLAPPIATTLEGMHWRAVHGYWVIALVDVCFIATALIVKGAPNPKLAPAIEDGPSNRIAAVEAGNSSPNVSDPKAVKEGYTKMADEDDDDIVRTYPVVLCCLSVMLAGVVEASVAFWLYAFSTTHLQLPASAASTLNTIFWAAFTGTRLTLGCVVSKVGSEVVLKSSLIVAILFAQGMIWAGSSMLLPCIGMVGVGVGVAGLYANSLSVLRLKSFIGGREQGFIRLFAAMGAMAGSSSVGMLMKVASIGDNALPSVVAVGLAGEAVVLALMFRQ